MAIVSDVNRADGGWYDESLSLPRMDVVAADRFPGPVGFIDFDRMRAKAENAKNVSECRCQIRTVRFK